MVKQDVQFIRNWLYHFIMMHKVQFMSKASSYLESKGLNIETWIEGIKEGKKGDVLALYGLNDRNTHNLPPEEWSDLDNLTQ